MKYTVIGIWENDAAITAGVIEGDHPVGGGNESGYWEQGVWAVTVEADGMEEASYAAMHEMESYGVAPEPIGWSP